MNALPEGLGAVVSIHDVMPETLSAVQRCLDECHRHDVCNVYLLVVPGRSWSAAQLRQLRYWVSQGCLLAGHGWLHHCDTINRPYHRLHAALMSRNVAEHLALDAREIAALMTRCHDWFTRHQLPPPSLYVPPAWALGRIDQRRLRASEFSHVETIRGVQDLQAEHWELGPLLGYEADTALRSRVLSVWNRANRRMAVLNGTVRIGIHPQDLDLHLSNELRRDLQQCHSIDLGDVFGGSCSQAPGQATGQANSR